MPTIKNTTRKPLSVPLPGGKKLFLGPGEEGQIAPTAGEHPPVAALVEAGDLEIVLDDRKSGGRGWNDGSPGSSWRSHNPGKKIFRSGDG